MRHRRRLHAPGDANLRIEITRTRPAAGAGTPGRRALARGRTGRYTITTGPASSYTPPELINRGEAGDAIPVPTVPRRTARPTGGYNARVARAARAASPPAAPRPPEGARRTASRTRSNSNHSELRMGAHVSRRGFCEENVPSQWRLVYRLFTGVLPVGTSRLRQRHHPPTLHSSHKQSSTDTSQAPR